MAPVTIHPAGRLLWRLLKWGLWVVLGCAGLTVLLVATEGTDRRTVLAWTLGGLGIWGAVVMLLTAREILVELRGIARQLEALRDQLRRR